MRAAAVLVLASVLAGCGDSPAPRASIVLVTLDTTRPDHLSCNGYGRATTPNLDAFAAAGTLFTECWAQAPETGPSLASVLTSRTPPAVGVRANGDPLVDEAETLATVASRAGMRTGAFVSTTLLRASVCRMQRGFEVYDDEMTDPCFGHERAQRIASRTLDRAIEWLAKQDGPFVLWVHLYDPHGPYDPPVRSDRLGRLAAQGLPQELRMADIPTYQRVGTSLDPADYVDRYDHEIAYMDGEIARLLAAVDPQRTVVAVHADHGEALGEDGYWFRHGSLLHDAALRVPLILRGPGVPAGRRIEEPVRNLDIVPTLLALAGLPPLAAAQGHDLGGVLAGGSAPPLESIAEACPYERIKDSTGIDVRWKVRYRSQEVDFTWWPAAQQPQPATEEQERAVEKIRAWIAARAPPRPGAGETQVPEEVQRALRSLGYR